MFLSFDEILKFIEWTSQVGNKFNVQVTQSPVYSVVVGNYQRILFCVSFSISGFPLTKFRTRP